MEPRRASQKQIGRPRQFDPERAIERALEVFWRKGYEAASLPDLTRAMGINRPSLYAAFGNKEELFRRVLDRYATAEATFIATALEKPTASQVIEHIFRGQFDFLTSKHHPRGCLLMQGTPPCGDPSDPVRREIVARRNTSESAIRHRLQQAQSQGDFSRKVNTTYLAKFITAIAHGISIQAASGATRAQLQALAVMATRACNDYPFSRAPKGSAFRSKVTQTFNR
jgi:AcrR family transcriptional regulator